MGILRRPTKSHQPPLWLVGPTRSIFETCSLLAFSSFSPVGNIYRRHAPDWQRLSSGSFAKKEVVGAAGVSTAEDA